MNVTNHCLKRYAQRFKDVIKEDLDRDVIANKELYIEELNKMFSFSKLIYTGRFNETNENTNYYIVDNIILVVDLSNTKIITLYRIEFGFERKIDKDILTGLLSELDDAESEYIQAMDIVKEQKNEMDYKILSLEEDIASTLELLNTLKLSLKELRQELEQWDGEMEVTVLDKERNEYEFVGVAMLSGRYFEPKLAIKFE